MSRIYIFFLRGLLFLIFATLSLVSSASFWENKGQWPEEVLFQSQSPAGAIWVCKDRILFHVIHPDDQDMWHVPTHFPDSMFSVRNHVFSIDWQGTSWAGLLETRGRTRHYSNFFLGNDPGKWASKVYGFEIITLKEFWPGIDLVVSHGSGLVKYDYVIHPQADASQIQWKYSGLDAAVLRNGRIDLETSVGFFSEVIPESWTILPDGTRKAVKTYYMKEGDVWKFQTDSFHPNATYIIDPELIVATFIGGFGMGPEGPPEMGWTWSFLAGFGSSFSIEGKMIGYGEGGSLGFPVTVGAYQTTPISKASSILQFSSDGSTLEWATYIGAEVIWSNMATAMTVVVIYDLKVSENGLIYFVAGNSHGPLPNPINGTACPECFPSTLPPLIQDGICNRFLSLAILSGDGSQLIASRFIGCIAPTLENGNSGINGQYGNIAEIDFSSNGDVIMACTVDNGSFPTTEGAYDTTFTGTTNAAVMRITSDLETVVWGTFYGTSNTFGLACKVLPDDRVVIAGRAWASTAVTTEGAYMHNPGSGGNNGYVAIMSADGSALEYATHLAWPIIPGSNGGSFEIIRFVDTDPEGNIWVFGVSPNNSSNIACSDGVFCEPGGSNFIAKLSPDLSELLLVSRVGSPLGKQVWPTAFMIDNCGYVYISGNSGIPTFQADGNYPPPDFGPIALTPNAIQSQGGFYLAVYEPDMAGLHYGTLFGGNHTDAGRSRFDKKGVVYQTVCIPSWMETYFEATPNAWSTEIGPNLTVEMGMFKIDFQSPATTAIMTAEVLPSEGCYPVQVQTNNYSTEGSYTWLANGTQVEPDENGIINLNQGGTVELQLAVYNAESCNQTDTAKVTLQIPFYSALEAAWAVDAPNPCAQGSTAVSAQWTGQNATSLTWDSWAGTSSEESFAATVTEAGDYSFSLTAMDSLCGTSETLTYAFSYHPFVFAAAGAASDSCALPVTFSGQFLGEGADSVVWSVEGNNTVGNDFSTSFSAQGIYTVVVTAASAACNQSETEAWTFTVWGTLEASVNPPAETVYCLGEVVSLSGQTNTGTAQWLLPGSTVPGTNFTLIPQEAGTFNYTFQATDPAACNGFFEQTITMTFVEPPEAAFTLLSESVPCEDNPEVEVAFTGNNASELLWDMGDGTASGNSVFVHTYTESGNYSIELTAFNPPCQPATAMQSVEIWVGASTPSTSSGAAKEVNIITPNGDGVNDCLRFFDEDLVDADFTVFELKVFNRWGTLVFSTSSPANHWCANESEAGTYFYALRYGLVCGDDAGETEQTGAVTVVR